MNNRSPVDRGMDNRSPVGRGMDNRGPVGRGMNNWGPVGRGMDNRGLVSWGSMVDGGRIIGMIGWDRSICSPHREGSRSNNTSRRLLKGTIAMYRLWGSMGLADHRGMYSTMGLVDRVAD